MGKVAVGKTLIETLSFVFGRYLSLLGAAWLPLLILCVAYYFAFVPFIGGMMAIAREAALHPHTAASAPDVNSIARLNSIMRFMPLATLAGVIVVPWMHVAVIKAALGVPRRFPAAYLEFGNDEFRLIAANLIVMALAYGAIFAVVIVGAIVAAIGAALVAGGAVQSNGFKVLLISMAILAGIAALCAFIYAAIRLTFFLAPATVMEKKIAVVRSWELGKGNFWRIIAIFVALFFILVALEFVLMMVLMVPIFAVAHAGAGSHNPAAAFASLRPYLPLALLLGLLILPIFIGLQLAPAAFAYRSLVLEPKGTDALA